MGVVNAPFSSFGSPFTTGSPFDPYKKNGARCGSPEINVEGIVNPSAKPDRKNWTFSIVESTDDFSPTPLEHAEARKVQPIPVRKALRGKECFRIREWNLAIKVNVTPNFQSGTVMPIYTGQVLDSRGTLKT